MPSATEARQLTPKAREVRSAFADRLTAELGRVVVGQRDIVERVLIGLLTRGHLLIEGVPGIAKTLLAKSVAESVRANFSRVQFTPDLLPADLVGTLIYDQRDQTFVPRKGPVFTNFLLADEINRAPAKVQSALLEAMQERQVTIGDETWKLDEPFVVLATQNPIEQEGTYPLPEAQVDRFMMKLKMGFPELDDERVILKRMANFAVPQVEPVVGPQEIAAARDAVEAVYVDDRIRDYILSLVRATRDPAAFGVDTCRARGTRRLAARESRPLPGGPRPRVPGRPRFHRSRRRETPGARCDAPPAHPFLRGGSGRSGRRRNRAARARRRGGSLRIDPSGGP